MISSRKGKEWTIWLKTAGWGVYINWWDWKGEGILLPFWRSILGLLPIKLRRRKEAGERMEQIMLGNHLERRGQPLVLLLFVEGKEGFTSFVKKEKDSFCLEITW